jgi:mannose-1-phosphate guanylyltransferase
VSREEELLGTAGGVCAAGALLGSGDVLVWNSDMIGPLDAARLVEAHARATAEGALATLAVRLCEAGTRGNVGLDEDGRVVRLRGETAVKDAKPEVRAAEFVGVHVVGEELRRALPRAGCLVGDVYLPAMRRGGRIASIVIDAEMIDIGTPSEYVRANLRWLASRGMGSWCGDAASVANGVTLDRAIVGEGACVVGLGRVESCVVWPGAEAVAPIADAIVTPNGLVRVERLPR